jgi:hypothetical protein
MEEFQVVTEKRAGLESVGGVKGSDITLFVLMAYQCNQGTE